MIPVKVVPRSMATVTSGFSAILGGSLGQVTVTCQCFERLGSERGNNLNTIEDSGR